MKAFGRRFLKIKTIEEENVMSKVFKSFMSMVITALLLASLTVVASAQNAPSGYVFIEETLTYNCTISLPIIPNINFNMPLTIRGHVPTVYTEEPKEPSVRPNQDFKLLNTSATAEVPGDIVETLDGTLRWNYVQGTVTKFEVLSDNVPALFDVAPLPIASMPVPKDGSDLVFTVPAIGGIDIDPIIAGSSGVINISAGNVTATFVTAGGGLPIPLTANCQPPSNANLVEIAIVP